jgi:hypothetical protein
MSNINAENITVTNLNVAYINGQPVTSLNCYNQQDDCYDCSQENTDCPHCIDLPQTCVLGETGLKGDTGDIGPKGDTGPAGADATSPLTNSYYLDTNSTTSINPNFFTLTFAQPKNTSEFTTNFLDKTNLLYKGEQPLNFGNIISPGIAQFASPANSFNIPIIPNSNWILSLSLNANFYSATYAKIQFVAYYTTFSPYQPIQLGMSDIVSIANSQSVQSIVLSCNISETIIPDFSAIMILIKGSMDNRGMINTFFNPLYQNKLTIVPIGVKGDPGPKGDPGDQVSVGLTSADTTTYTTSKIVFHDLNGFSVTLDQNNSNKIVVDYTLLTRPPPKIVFYESTSETKYIYISWVYPYQIHGGSFDMYLPLINNITVKWTAKISDNVETGIILQNEVVNCLKYNGTSLNTNYITRIVLTNSSTGFDSDPDFIFKNLKFPDNIDRYCCIYYNSMFKNLVDSTDNNITAYYSNFSGYISSSCSFNPFLNSAPPGAPPSAPTYDNRSVQGTNVKMTIFSAPINSNEIMLGSNNFIITQYKATGSSEPSFKRYSGYAALKHDQHTFFSSTIDINAINLYPDSIYTYSTSAKNDSAYEGFGNESVSSSYTTLPLNPSLTINS